MKIVNLFFLQIVKFIIIFFFENMGGFLFLFFTIYMEKYYNLFAKKKN